LLGSIERIQEDLYTCRFQWDRGRLSFFNTIRNLKNL
jgi:hypothetical protein